MGKSVELFLTNEIKYGNTAATPVANRIIHKNLSQFIEIRVDHPIQRLAKKTTITDKSTNIYLKYYQN